VKTEECISLNDGTGSPVKRSNNMKIYIILLQSVLYVYDAEKGIPIFPMKLVTNYMFYRFRSNKNNINAECIASVLNISENILS